jgi:adenylate kinase
VCKLPKDTIVIFDGIPRDGNQKTSFDALMKDCGRSFRALHFVLTPEEGAARIAGRAKQEGRADDANEEAIRRRMALFHEKTMPVVEDYKSRGIVEEVDGGKSADEVFGELKKILGLE